MMLSWGLGVRSALPTGADEAAEVEQNLVRGFSHRLIINEIEIKMYYLTSITMKEKALLFTTWDWPDASSIRFF